MHFDVAIIGAGPAGSLIATQVAAGGRETLLVEETNFSGPRLGEFLSPQVKAQINQLGILAAGWERDHREAQEFLSYWGGPQPGTRNYLFDPYGPALILDRAKFDWALARAADQRGVRLMQGTTFSGATRSDDGWDIRLQGPDWPYVSTSLLIFCHGRSGRLPRLNVQRVAIDRLICLGMRLANYRGDQRPAIETYEHGWVYTVGLACGELMVNLFTESDPANCRRVTKSPHFILNELRSCPIAVARSLNCTLTESNQVSLFAADASSGFTRPATGPGWCVAGDRAQSTDPLSSTGIARAVAHAKAVADSILASKTAEDIDWSAYCANLDASFESYLETRRVVYASERRWATPFWQRRSNHPQEDSIIRSGSRRRLNRRREVSDDDTVSGMFRFVPPILKRG